MTVRAGLLESNEQLLEACRSRSLTLQPMLNGRRLLYTLLRGLIAHLVDDTARATFAELFRHGVDNPQRGRRLPPLVRMSPQTGEHACKPCGSSCASGSIDTRRCGRPRVRPRS